MGKQYKLKNSRPVNDSNVSENGCLSEKLENLNNTCEMNKKHTGVQHTDEKTDKNVYVDTVRNICGSQDGLAVGEVSGNELLLVDDTKQKSAPEIITVNVSGTQFHISNHVWLKIKASVPYKYEAELHDKDGGVFVERHAEAFRAILYSYQGGDLHIPVNICPSSFKTEMQFWGISEAKLAQCCFAAFVKYFDDQGALKILETDEDKRVSENNHLMRLARKDNWPGIQARAWLVLNEPFYSKAAKVYFFVSGSIVLISLFVLVAGTHSAFRRPLNEVEWKIYLGDEWRMYDFEDFDDDSNSTGVPEGTPETGVDDGQSVDSSPEPETDTGVGDEHSVDSSPETETETGVGDEQSVDSSPEPETETGVDDEQSVDSSPEPETETGVGDEQSVDSSPEPETETGVGDEHSIYSSPEPETATGVGDEYFLDSSPEPETETGVGDEQSVDSTPEPETEAEPGNAPSDTAESDNTTVSLSPSSGPETVSETTVYTIVTGYANESSIVPESTPETLSRFETSAEPESHASEPEVSPETEMVAASVAYTSIASDTNDISPETTPEMNRMSTHAPATAEGEPNSDGDSSLEPNSEPESETEPKSETSAKQNSLNESLKALPASKTVRLDCFEYIEHVAVVLFSLDLITRFIFCPFHRVFFRSFLNWVDILAIVVTYTRYITETIDPKEKFESSAVDAINCMQMVRVFRLFRLVKHFVGFRVLLYAFIASFREMMLMMLFLVIAMLFFSAFAFFSGDNTFTNIPDACWWAIVTMTTVGYGDMVPKIPLSKTVGALCAICGVCLIAVIIPIFVNNFTLFYSYSKVWGKQNAHQYRENHTNKSTDVKIAIEAIYYPERSSNKLQ